MFVNYVRHIYDEIYECLLIITFLYRIRSESWVIFPHDREPLYRHWNRLERPSALQPRLDLTNYEIRIRKIKYYTISIVPRINLLGWHLCISQELVPVALEKHSEGFEVIDSRVHKFQFKHSFILIVVFFLFNFGQYIFSLFQIFLASINNQIDGGDRFGRNGLCWIS